MTRMLAALAGGCLLVGAGGGALLAEAALRVWRWYVTAPAVAALVVGGGVLALLGAATLLLRVQ